MSSMVLQLARGVRQRAALVRNPNLHLEPKAIFHPSSRVRKSAGRVSVGATAAVGNDCLFHAQTTIGRGTLIASRVAFLNRDEHDFSDPTKPIRLSKGLRSGKIVIGDDCWIGFGVVLLAPVSIGRGVVVAAGSVVTRDLPDLCVAAGQPARPVRPRFSPSQVEVYDRSFDVDGTWFV